MEERLFEKFLELIEKRDEEIGYILGYSSFEYFYRRRMLFRISRGLPVDEDDNEIQELLRKRHANRILDRLQNKMRSGASKSAIEDYIKKRTPECDIIKLKVHLFKCVKPSTSQACSYKIQVMYDGHVIPTAYSGGIYNVYMVSPEGKTEMIDFRYGRDKVLYTWFLLHPRQFMTKQTIWCPDNPTRTAFANQNLMDMSKKMYPQDNINPLINYIQNKNWKKGKSGGNRTLVEFKNDFSQRKWNINAYVEQAWMKLGGEGNETWYTVQKEFETSEHITKGKTVPSRYLIKLDGANISIINKNQQYSIPSNYDLTQCRMEGKYDKYESKTTI